MKNIEEKIINQFKMNIAIDNYKNEFNHSKIKERKMPMKRKILATACASLVLVTGIVLATNIKTIQTQVRGLGKGIDTAVEHGYIANPEMDYQNSNTTVNYGEKIDNINTEAKIEDILMDDHNLSTKFNFKFEEKISQYINLENIHNIELPDLIITDEENRILYAGCDQEAFESYCQKNNLPYKFAEFNENYLNCGLNYFPASINKDSNTVELMYNMYTDKYPKSKKLNLTFGKIKIVEENNEKITTLTGNWQMEIDIPEKMYNRTSESYKVVSCSNKDFEIYHSEVTDTGFEIGVIINNIEEPKMPKELEEKYRGIVKKHLKEVDQTQMNAELYAELAEEPYKTMWNEYWRKRMPILTSGKIMQIGENQEKEKSYVQNSKGEKFECTFSPSRAAKLEWLNGNKYNFYETFAMTKYESTDKIKVVLNYYGELVTIELEKI